MNKNKVKKVIEPLAHKLLDAHDDPLTARFFEDGVEFGWIDTEGDIYPDDPQRMLCMYALVNPHGSGWTLALRDEDGDELWATAENLRALADMIDALNLADGN